MKFDTLQNFLNQKDKIFYQIQRIKLDQNELNKKNSKIQNKIFMKNTQENNHRFPKTQKIIYSHQQLQDVKKQTLIEQILSYRNRIKQYQTLSEELKNISSTIQNSEPISFDSSNLKLSITKSFFNNKISQDVNFFSKKSVLQRRISSSKKIKIYELQKKLYRLGKEHNQKFSSYMFDKRQLQVTQSTSKKLFDMINKEQNHKKTLQKQHQKIILEVNQIGLKIQQSLEQVKSIEKRKQKFEEEKVEILNNIENLKIRIDYLKLGQEQKNQQGQQQQNQQGQQQQKQLSMINAKKEKQNSKNQSLDKMEKQKGTLSKRKVIIQGIEYDLIQSKSSIQITNLAKTIQQISFNKNKKNTSIDFKNNKKTLIDFQPITIQTTQTQHITKFHKISDHFNQFKTKLLTPTYHTSNYSHQTNFIQLPSNKQKQQLHYIKKKRSKDIQKVQYYINERDQLHIKNQKPLLIQYLSTKIQNKIQVLSNIKSQLNHKLFFLQQQMISIQTQIKHHKTSLNLLKSKINSYSHFISRQNSKQLSNITIIQNLNLFLSQKQGYTGQMRGQIGTKVQQQTIIRMLNLAINKDLQILHLKINALIAHKNLLSHKIIKNQF